MESSVPGSFLTSIASELSNDIVSASEHAAITSNDDIRKILTINFNFFYLSM